MSTIIFPIERDAALHEELCEQSPLEVGWFVSLPDVECAFCAIGCCTQRMIVDASGDDDETYVIHAMLGVA